MNRQLHDVASLNIDSNVVPMVSGETGHVKNARVTAVNGKHVMLDYSVGNNEQRNIEGRVAFSCLVSPMVNDTVVCVQNVSGMHIVMAILDRPDDKPNSQDMTLNFPANANFKTQGGDLGFIAKDNVSLVAGESLVCASEKTIHKSQEALINYQNTTAQCHSVTAQFKTMHLIGDMINTMAKQAIQKFNHFVRRSSESDQVSAAQMDRKVDGLYSMKSKTTLMISKKDTKIDGERIHMG